jgi:two-component system phosphate regulon sensor histidine kinase PhoR
MKKTRWFFHPVFIFVFSVIALGLSLFLFIYWYMEVSTGLEAIVGKYHLDRGQILESRTWVVIMVLSILVGLILTGILVIFVYGQKTLQLYRLQHNFINNFTHELKTPVTSMKLYLETFLKHDLSKDKRDKYIRYMLSDVNRLSGNINSILNLAKIESKLYEGEHVTADLVIFSERFYKNNHHLFQDCEINIHNPSGLSFLYEINPSMFEMLIMNLTTNAIKYNESGKPALDITFLPINNKLNICFKDNGIGIAKAELKKIFKKFYQVGIADDMTAKGSGLGLYLVGNIAKIHKGKIKAESKGGGSVFTLVLPFEAEQPDEAENIDG